MHGIRKFNNEMKVDEKPLYPIYPGGRGSDFGPE